MLLLRSLLLIATLMCSCSERKPVINSSVHHHESVHVIPLKTGTGFRFKGLAIADDGSFFLGSWDRKEIVKIYPQQIKHEVLPTPYSGKLNGMGCYIRDGVLYAVMNEVNDAPEARAISVLLLFDIKSLKLIKAFEVRGWNGRNHFNQVVVNSKGVAYISNTLKSSVFVVDTRNSADTLKELVHHPDLSWVHGLDLSKNEKTLFTTSYDAGIKFFNLETLTFSSYRDTTFAGDDGLKYLDGALYGVGSNTIKKYTLDEAESAVVKSEIILKDHPVFNDARCLYFKDGYLYCLANIEFEPVMVDTNKQTMSDTYVLKIAME